MNDSKNLILAVVLSALVLLGWTWAANKYFPTANPPSTKIEAGKQQPLPQPQAQPSAPTTAKALAVGHGGARVEPRVSASARPRSPARSTSRARRSTICCWSRSARRSTKNSPPVRLLSPLGAPGAYIAQFGWTGQGAAAPDLNTVWTADSNALTPGHPVTLTTQMPDGTAMQMKIVRRRRLPVHRRAGVHQRFGKAGAVAPYRPRQPRRASRRHVDLDQPRRSDRRVRRQGGLRHQLEGPRPEGQPRPSERQRLARLHRQILADRAGSDRQR